MEQGIGVILDQRWIGAQPAQERIKQGEALGLAMADHRACQREERARHRKGRHVGMRDGSMGCKQISRRIAYLPDDLIGRHILGGQGARRVTPPVEIVRHRDPRDMHGSAAHAGKR